MVKSGKKYDVLTSFDIIGPFNAWFAQVW